DIFRHGDAEKARGCHRAMEVVRKFPAQVALHPVQVVERLADAFGKFTDRSLGFVQFEIHGSSGASKCARYATTVRSKCGFSRCVKRLERAGSSADRAVLVSGECQV